MVGREAAVANRSNVMAVHSFTADASTNTAGTPVQALGINDVVFVGREATLTALGSLSEVFDGVSGHQITINGELFSANDDAMSTTGGNNRVLVGSDGFISADDSAFDFGAGGNQIETAGTIQTGFVAINIIGSGGNYVANIGYITAFASCISVAGEFNEIFNGGTLVSENGVGVTANGGNNFVRNSGSIIAGGGNAIIFGGIAVDTNFLINEGTIRHSATRDAAFNFGNANDTVVNTGLIGGGLLGAGNDLFDGREGITEGLIRGDAGDDTLLGGNSNETFSGGSGADFISGGGGFDFVSFTLSNALRVSLSDPSQNTGDARGDEYEGIEGLVGSQFNDSLTGDSAANTIDGHNGVDTMTGLAGNDRYKVNSIADRVIEATGGGADTIYATVSFALNTNGVNVESLRLQGTANNFAKGTSLNNNLYGNSGDNLLDGLAGNDALVGREGNDTFRFTATLNATTNVDRILDFSVVDDTIAIDNAKFTGLASGNLLAGHFFIGAAAHDGNDRIIYNATNGALMFDRDGTGAIAAVRFATLDAGLALTAADFVVV
jgi:serralysin